uniref:DUF4283 domain-containing protein n=1 Tax=Chenopodium quinoa TaxID=63459 RepID=A0A803KNE4_CHEQI
MGSSPPEHTHAATTTDVPLDEQPQVQQDIEELSNTCLFGVLLDLRTIITRTKANWKLLKGDVEYLEMGNNWILLRFANPNDKQIVWNERAWHVQVEILVLLGDLCLILFLRKFSGLIFGLGFTLPTLYIIRFVRACISVDISKPFAQIRRFGGQSFTYLIWYEDFSEGCAFCGEENHSIEKCPLLTAPPKEVKIVLQKAPGLFSTYTSASSSDARPENHQRTTQKAFVVHVRSKQKNQALGVEKAEYPSNFSIQEQVPRNSSSKGIHIKEPTDVNHPSYKAKKGEWNQVKNKGKGKLSIANPIQDNDESSNDDGPKEKIKKNMQSNTLKANDEGTSSRPTAVLPTGILIPPFIQPQYPPPQHLEEGTEHLFYDNTLNFGGSGSDSVQIDDNSH